MRSSCAWACATASGCTRAPRLARHLVEVRAPARPCGGRDRALHERRRREHNRPAVGVEHLEGHLRAHQRAAEVHEDEHPVGRADLLHGGHHARGVRPDRAVVEPARSGDRDLLAAHLPRELRDALRERGAVGDQDEGDQLET